MADRFKDKKVLGVGGTGKIMRESILDLVTTTTASEVSKITVTDVDEKAGSDVLKSLNDPRVDFKVLDVAKSDETIALMQQYDLVLDGTAIQL